MAKDGTHRGGRRIRAGDKPDALADKIAGGRVANIMEFPMTELDGADLADAAELFGTDMPNPSEYLSARQRNGKPLGADDIFRETWLWLKERGCERLVNPRLLESYAQAFARFIQCEEAVSQYGLIGKHPTTGGAIASPFVQMGQAFQKQSNLLWYEIFDIVKQNCTTTFSGSPQEDHAGVCQEFCVNHFSVYRIIVFHEFRHTLIHQQLVANERPVWYPAPRPFLVKLLHP